MLLAFVHSMNLDKAISDLSGKSLDIVTRTVESSAYLNNVISLCSSISKSFKNKLKMYGPLTLPNTTLGGTFANYFPPASDAIIYHPLLSSL